MAAAGAGKRYWVVSVPKDAAPNKNPFGLVQEKAAAVSKDLTTNFRFEVPDLRIGTLDALLSLSDDLVKTDTQCETVVHKIAKQLFDLSSQGRPGDDVGAAEGGGAGGAAAAAPRAGDADIDQLAVNNVSVDTYLTHFNWDEAKFPPRNQLKEIVEQVVGLIGKIDDEFKTKYSHFNEARSKLEAIRRKNMGNLMVRDLTDLLVGQEAAFTESESLTTLLVVVPKYMYRDWETNYETMDLKEGDGPLQLIVPRSSRLLYEDQEHGLWTVTVFKRAADEFKVRARKRRFNVRDFKPDAEESRQGKENKKKMEEEARRQWTSLVRWCKTNFSEAFIAWTHVKAVRVFVESVLRYGLPANFQAVLMLPNKKYEQKVRLILDELFDNLAGGSTIYGQQEEEGAAGANMGASGGAQSYAYVSLEVNLEFR